MIKKEDNIRSESYYPDSNYLLDQDNIPKENLLSEDQISYTTKFEWLLRILKVFIYNYLRRVRLLSVT